MQTFLLLLWALILLPTILGNIQINNFRNVISGHRKYEYRQNKKERKTVKKSFICVTQIFKRLDSNSALSQIFFSITTAATLHSIHDLRKNGVHCRFLFFFTNVNACDGLL